MTQGTQCGLCDLPCGRQPVVRNHNAGDIAFCCMGCANVYAILLESGVIASGQNIRETEVFRRSLELGLISNPNATPAPTVDIDPNAPTAEMLLQVNGMWCSACAWLIEHALRGLPGVVSADVFFASDLAKVKYCPLVLPRCRNAPCRTNPTVPASRHTLVETSITGTSRHAMPTIVAARSAARLNISVKANLPSSNCQILELRLRGSRICVEAIQKFSCSR